MRGSLQGTRQEIVEGTVGGDVTLSYSIISSSTVEEEPFFPWYQMLHIASENGKASWDNGSTPGAIKFLHASWNSTMWEDVIVETCFPSGV